MKMVKVLLCICIAISSQLSMTLAGSCYSKISSDGKCSGITANDVTQEECCSKLGIGFDDSLSSASFFMIQANIKKQNCKPCRESCDNMKCNVGKRCILKKGKPKCVCTPNCRASAMKKSQQKFSVIRMPETRDSRRFEPSSQTLEMQNDEPTLIVANFNARNANQRATMNVDNKTVEKNDTNEALIYSPLIKADQQQQKQQQEQTKSNMTNDALITNHARSFAMQLQSGYFNQFSTKVMKVNEEFYIGTLPKFAHYNPVCSTDGRTFKNECQLRKRACRQENESLKVAYRGHCQHTCQFIKCTNGKTCIEDQESNPLCVKCPKCSTKSQNLTLQVVEKMVCGADGVTYRSMCELRQKSCKIGKAIPLLKRGPCTEALSCSSCSSLQKCLPDLMTHRPKCVTCTNKCPRKNSRTTGSKQICGRNNITYHSWCHMLKDSCNTGYYIDMKHEGECQS